MEVKKSEKAQLDDKRPTWFLLGLVFVLSVLFAALEYTSTWNGESIDEELLEGLSAEMESAPMLDTRRYVTVSPVLSGRVSADKLKRCGECGRRPAGILRRGRRAA